MFTNRSLLSNTWNSKQNANNLVSLLPYKMAADFRHLIIFIMPRRVIKPIYRVATNDCVKSKGFLPA